MESTVFQKYESYSVDDLYAEIAAQTVGPGLLPGPKAQQVSVGKSKFAAVKELVASKICEPEVRHTLQASNDVMKLAVAIADIISTILAGVPLVLVSMLIAKLGLDAICSNQDPALRSS